jgi:5-oxoprolinase (ATP-hydrolysing)
VLLATTSGDDDALRIGSQERPDIFARHILELEPLPPAILEIAEPVGADGTAHLSLDEAAALGPAPGLARAQLRPGRAEAAP